MLSSLCAVILSCAMLYSDVSTSGDGNCLMTPVSETVFPSATEAFCPPHQHQRVGPTVATRAVPCSFARRIFSACLCSSRLRSTVSAFSSSTNPAIALAPSVRSRIFLLIYKRWCSCGVIHAPNRSRTFVAYYPRASTRLFVETLIIVRIICKFSESTF